MVFAKGCIDRFMVGSMKMVKSAQHATTQTPKNTRRFAALQPRMQACQLCPFAKCYGWMGEICTTP